MSNPSITVFIPTYRRPHLLKKAIESALNQTWKDLQIVVCDNASNDETAQIVAQLSEKDSRLRYICHPQNIGMLANYEFGLLNVKTPYFSFLSDDDILLPHFCETALQGFAQFPDVAFFACSTAIICKQRGIVRIPLDLWPKEGFFLPPEAVTNLIGKYPVPTTVLFRKEVVSKAKIDFENPVGWDCDFLIQLASQLPFAISKRPCGIFLAHADSLTSAQNFQASSGSIERLITRVGSFNWMGGEVQSSVEALLRIDLAYCSASFILSDLFHKRFLQARKNSFSLLVNSPLKKRALLLLVASIICSFFPFMHAFLMPMKKIRGFCKRKSYSSKGFEDYQKWVCS